MTDLVPGRDMTNPALEDSTDLTPETVQQAVDATEAEVFKWLWKDPSCCENPRRSLQHVIRRLRPHHYWIIQARCTTCKSNQRLVFRLTDPKWRSV